MERRLYPIWLAVVIPVLMVASFVAGAGVMYGVSQESILGVTARVAQMAPALVEIEEAEGITSATDLQPLATFWQVRDRILRDFVYPIEDDTRLTYGAVRGMLAALEDPYSRFMTPEEFAEFQRETEGHYQGIGAWLAQRTVGDTNQIEVVILSVIPEGPASKVDLRPDDVVKKVDDKPVRGMGVDRVSKLIRGPKDTKVKLAVAREGSPELIELTIVRMSVDIPPVEQKMLEDGIGYVWLRLFHEQAEDELRAALQELIDQGIQGLILDLSINGGGLFYQAISVASLFMEEGEVVLYVGERETEPHPFKALPGLVVPADLPLVVLVDGGSASAAEIVAGALQDTGRAKVVGQHTFGKSKVQTVMALNDRSALVLSTAVYLTPNKRDLSEEYEVGKRGIKPDVVYPPLELGPEERLDHQKVEQWHEEQIARAADVLKESMAE